MADDAWRVAAVLHVAAVRCPIDGERAEDAVDAPEGTDGGASRRLGAATPARP